MPMKYVAAALLASTLLSAPALAQSAKQPADSNATTAQKIKMQQQGTWRTSKLIGLSVYNNNNEKIGDISELITEASGKADVVVIGIGGFLGIGESNVGLPWNQVKFVMEPRPASTASNSTTRTTTTGAGALAETATKTTTTANNREYPDHAVVNMTKDQLKAMPAFKYMSDASSTTTRTNPAPAR
jgi:sporulation protein YlmC with PRC-barrel domain